MTYRSRYYTTLQPVAVLDVLMADETNPRSLHFQLSHVVDLYGKLPRHIPEELDTVTKALAKLRNVDLRAVHFPLPGAVDSDRNSGERRRLKQVLKELESFLPAWSNNLSDTYFSHVRTLPITIGD